MTPAAEQEFEAFSEREYVPMMRWLAAMGAAREDAEDAAQVALFQVWSRWRQLRNRRAYLYRVAKNELGRFRRLRGREAALGDAAGCEAGQARADDGFVRLQAGIVRQYLLAVPPRQRAVLAGRYDGYRDDELAAVMGVAAATIRSDRRHARASLRQLASLVEEDPRGRVLSRAHAEMRAGNLAPPGSRLVISQSWARSAAHLPGPGHGPQAALLGPAELSVRRSMSPLNTIGPAVCAKQSRATGLLMVITDADGRVLWRSGDRDVLRRGEDDGHGDGACLAEHAVGTGGISLALAAGHPVVVCGPEHYCPAQHDLVCAGAPVYHPADGRLAGALCLSAPWPAAPAELLKIIDSSARQVRRYLARTRI